VVALMPAKIAVGFTPLVVLSFGLNELAATTTAANIAAIVKILQDAGADVVVIGLPRPKESFNTTANRKYTNPALARAAEFSGCAFVPILDLVDNRLRAMGISRDDLAEANGQHYPGVTQFNFYGRELFRHVADGLDGAPETAAWSAAA
jgi:RNase H-fold protein (predicted Holliday junction resolvase)